MRILLTNDDGIHAEGLAALERITGGRSLTANIALIRNNARVAAGVAAALTAA